MTVREFYEMADGNYEEAIGRFLTDARILKYTRKFPASVNPGELEEAIIAKDWPLAFRLAHTIKGVCLNMSYVTLSRLSSELTELLRSGSPAEDPMPYFVRMKDEYDRVTALIAGIED